jgi:lysophospholipase L1-like esterase
MAVYGTIVCLGDSLTHGARDDYGRCYPMELSDMLWNEYKQRWLCAEEGVNGERSSDVLRRALSVIKKYPEAHEVVLLCGTNDSKDRFDTPPEIYKQNMEGILRIAAMYDKEVIICYLPDLNGFGAPDYSQESPKRIEKFNGKITELVAEYPNIIKGVVDLRGIPADYYADGVHFKNVGYVEIARRVFGGIREKRSFKKYDGEKGCPFDAPFYVYDEVDGCIKPDNSCPRDPKLTTYFGESIK